MEEQTATPETKLTATSKCIYCGYEFEHSAPKDLAGIDKRMQNRTTKFMEHLMKFHGQPTPVEGEPGKLLPPVTASIIMMQWFSVLAHFNSNEPEIMQFMEEMRGKLHEATKPVKPVKKKPEAKLIVMP